eukprot:15288252-Ditylum_brightwellii.AAC.1
MKQIQSVCMAKLIGTPEYYLGNGFKHDLKGRWCIRCKKYIVEAVGCVERIFGKLTKHDTPMVARDHPEMDYSKVSTNKEHQKYQMSIVSYLACFVACPRKGHLEQSLYVFGYLKKKPNRQIRVDARDLIVVNNGTKGQLHVDVSAKLWEQYPEAEKVLDDKVPKPLFQELAITAYVDSDHVHDKVTWQSITGLIIFLGRTPVQYQSKQQGAVETSTYGAEFMAIKTVVDEVMAVRYMLRCLGVK